MTAAPAADTLRLAVHPDPFTPRLRIIVNGADLNDSQRPLSHRGHPFLFLPPRCSTILPPEATALLPTARPTQAMVGVCTCGEAGCNSLWVRVRRCADRVVWEPDDSSSRHTVDRRWSFELVPYLDEIDDAVVASDGVQPRAHAVAREVRRRRDSLDGFGMSTREQDYRLVAAFVAWDEPGPDPVLGIEVAGTGGLGHYLVPLPPERSDDEILDELHDFHPERYRRDSWAPWVRDPPWPAPGSRRRPVPS